MLHSRASPYCLPVVSLYPNLTVDNELELLIDETCPLTESLVMDTAYVSNVVSALNKLIPLIDDDYWKMLNHIPSHLWMIPARKDVSAY